MAHMFPKGLDKVAEEAIREMTNVLVYAVDELIAAAARKGGELTIEDLVDFKRGFTRRIDEKIEEEKRAPSQDTPADPDRV